MRDDLARLTSSTAALQKSMPPRTTQAAARPRAPGPAPADPGAGATQVPFEPLTSAATAAPAAGTAPAPVSIAGRSETELRALFGAPTSEEDRPPGKRWRYRDGSCTMDIQLYPDVQTKQFGTLAYEVKSDDNSDEGKRACLAQFQSRAQPRP